MKRWLARGVIALGALTMLLPFWLMLVYASHGKGALFEAAPPLWFGDQLGANLRLLFEQLPFWRNLALSLYVATMSTILALVLCSSAGFVFAVYRFPGRRVLFALVLAGMLLPPYMAMIPSYLLIDALGWIDTPRALWLPTAACALGVFLMRQYIASTVPTSTLDAARIDGCSEWQLFRRVVLPQCGPALATLALIVFVSSWNNFILPLTVLRTPEMYTVPLALRSLQNPTNTEWGLVMAGAALASLPLMLLFAFTSRQMMAGMMAGVPRD
ncbi:carbohydrate ABC transporter permease [Chitinolyticbacter albus]|uniref:carbohydrate ABC transporter permease n=1 Tax=Chitinolyticbacter albus TaxID=2961951 RepID=UPI0021097F3C|nr:carbohydrate ABC transporter permease [Chitinolyticbacter albus]